MLALGPEEMLTEALPSAPVVAEAAVNCPLVEEKVTFTPAWPMLPLSTVAVITALSVASDRMEFLESERAKVNVWTLMVIWVVVVPIIGLVA